MKQKKPITINSKITSILRKLWMWSPERREALKQHNYSCKKCGIKQSKKKGQEVKVEVDHINGINWQKIIAVIREELLVNPSKLQVLCKECHKEKTYGHA